MRIPGALLMLGIAGCSNSHVYGGPVGGMPGPMLPSPTAEPDRGPISPRPTGANPASTRLTCRGNGYASGWIAVAYSEGMPECVAGGEKYAAALLQRYEALPKDTELYVCSDQRVPGNWVKSPLDPNVEPGDHCPSSEHPGPVRDRVMLIRRVR